MQPGQPVTSVHVHCCTSFTASISSVVKSGAACMPTAHAIAKATSTQSGRVHAAKALRSSTEPIAEMCQLEALLTNARRAGLEVTSTCSRCNGQYAAKPVSPSHCESQQHCARCHETRLLHKANAARVRVKDEDALGAVARGVGVVALRPQVLRVARQVQREHVEQGVCGAVQAITVGQPALCTDAARGYRDPADHWRCGAHSAAADERLVHSSGNHDRRPTTGA